MKTKLYTILLTSCTAGYAWLLYGFSQTRSGGAMHVVCPIKLATGVPCPSCGTTGSTMAILKGDFLAGLTLNPFGFIVAAILLITPIWILYDRITRRETLFHFYKELEQRLKRPSIALPLIVLVIVNWIWNITKGL